MIASTPFASDIAGSTIDISAYVLHPLQRDPRWVIYRGLSAAESAGPGRVLVGEPTRTTAETLDAMQRSLALREELEPAWAVRPIALAERDGRTVLVMDDPGGQPLDVLLEGRRGLGLARELGLFLRLAIGVAKAVGKVHARGLVHKDIKPANLFADSATGRVWLTGFGIASRRGECPAADVIAGTLPYMAPEQTGRMNRPVDARSDLYSLGVTLYEMLTGTLPFEASDPNEWLHSHIARVPEAPAHRLTDVEGVRGPVSSIIMKLLAKAPRDRFQTARGVQRDLERCLVQWEARGCIDDFPLAEHDAPDQLVLTERLYGREHEVETLLSSFERVAESGTTELVLVSGYSGIGKSALVGRLERALPAGRATFASGKFEQSKQHIPYLPLAQAFRQLTRRLLAKPEGQLREVRERLLQVLGSNGRILTDLVPELALIVGEQPPLVAPSRQDEKQRTHLVLRRFVGVFARPERPLVLFVDDLQWADAATLDALEDLSTNADVRHLMLIGAYRDNEVHAAHPLHFRLDAIRKAGAPARYVTLAPLDERHFARWIADTLREDVDGVTTLSRVVHEKTAGNPFFAVQFFSALVEKDLLRFDNDADRWSWDPSRIVALAHTDNVVDLLVERLKRLPPDTLSALQHMACLGNVAPRETLAALLGRPEEEVDAVLANAVRLALIDREGDSSYRFVHDRLQEAAYLLIPERLRAETHLRIGNLLDARTPADRREETIFEVVHQLNRGAALIADMGDREQLAERNLLAAKRARSSSAYASALEYTLAGLGSLTQAEWERRRELRFELELLRAECESWAGAYAVAAERLAELSTQVTSPTERAAVVCRRLDLHFALDRPDKAIDVCLEYLQQLGIRWPRQPTEEDVKREYLATWSLLRERPIEALLDLPLMTDPSLRATMDILATIGQAMFFAQPNLYVLAECLAVRLSLEHGNTDGSCDAYLRLGLISAQRFGDYGPGFRLGRVGYDLVERRGLKRFMAPTYTGFSAGLMPLGAPARLVRDLVRRVYNLVANEFGDRLQAIWYGAQHLDKLLAAGNSLVEVQREAEGAVKAASSGPIFVGSAATIVTSQLALVRSLRGLTDTFGVFDGRDFDERRFEGQFSDNPASAFAAGWYWVMKLMARFFAGDWTAALESASNAAQAHARSETMLFYAADFRLFGALAHAACFDSAAAEDRKRHAQAIAEHHRQLQAWAENCPENFEYRATLVAAEAARIEGRDTDAQSLYERAIRAARDNGFVHGEALGYEMASRFYAARGFDKIAQTYRTEAREAYLRWGADGKVRQLDRLHPPPRVDTVETTSQATFTAPVEQLDLATIVKVSEAVSSEIVPERLVETLMRTGLEHAGADRGVLLLVQDGELRVRAEATTAGTNGVSVRSTDASSASIGVPEAMLTYVARTQERVGIEDTSTAHPFADDAYFGRLHPRSVLCLPLTKQGALVGALYLENALTPHAFAPRMTALTVLASAAAMALENSRLYRDLARAEAERQTAVANERNRLAAEIHDGLAQGLAMIVMQLADAEQKLGPARSLAEKQLALVRELAVESLSYARRSVNVLRPGVVAGGLPRAIRDIVDSVRRHFVGSVELVISGEAVLLDYAVESGLASIAREALANATRHSGAARVEVDLSYSQDGTVRLVVKDEGAGFDANVLRADAYGLLSMQERAARAGVQLTIITEPGAGTEVVANWSPPAQSQ